MRTAVGPVDGHGAVSSVDGDGTHPRREHDNDAQPRSPVGAHQGHRRDLHAAVRRVHVAVVAQPSAGRSGRRPGRHHSAVVVVPAETRRLSVRGVLLVRQRHHRHERRWLDRHQVGVYRLLLFLDTLTPALPVV